MGEPGPLKGSWEFPMSLILLPVIGGPRTARFTLLAELTYPAPSFPSAPRGAPSGDRRANGGTQPLSVGRPPSILSCPGHLSSWSTAPHPASRLRPSSSDSALPRLRLHLAESWAPTLPHPVVLSQPKLAQNPRPGGSLPRASPASSRH